ncbi:hypothetical protein OSTOST_16605, partial [Ostertagia ostertagi]
GVARVKIQRTYGFVRFHKRAQAEVAKEKHNGALLNGSRLEVSWARPPPPGRTTKKSPPIRKTPTTYRKTHLLPHTASRDFLCCKLKRLCSRLQFLMCHFSHLLKHQCQRLPLAHRCRCSSYRRHLSISAHKCTSGTVASNKGVRRKSAQSWIGRSKSRLLHVRAVVHSLDASCYSTLTTILVGYLRLDGPLAPSKSDAEQNAIVFASNYLNISIC